MVERFAMLGIGEKDVRRCHKTLRNKIMKYMDDPRALLVHSIEIWSPDTKSEDPEGSCYIKWDITFLPEESEESDCLFENDRKDTYDRDL